MATHSSIPVWRIMWTEEPGGQLSMGSQRVGQDWSDLACMHVFKKKWQPTQVFLPGDPRDRGAWWSDVYGVTQSQTQLKQLSSSSNMNREKCVGVRQSFVVESVTFSYSTIWAFLVAQVVKNLPAMQETWVQSLGWEDPLEEAWQPTPVFLLGQSHGQRSLVDYIVHGVTKSQRWLSD